jgi:YhhN family
MAPLSIVLVGLFVVWALLLFGGYVLGRPSRPTDRRMPTWTRMASSFVLVLAAWVFLLISQGSGLAPYPFYIAIGMTLGFIGDLFMARLIPVQQHVLGGMAAFGLGHLAYIIAGLSVAQTLGLTATAPRLAAWLAWLVVGALAWYFIVFRGQEATALHWAALPYSLLLASTAGVATGLALQNARLIPLALGAVLFLASDLILAANLFAGRSFRRINPDDIVWLTYGPGQCLIVYTTAFLLATAV